MSRNLLNESLSEMDAAVSPDELPLTTQTIVWADFLNQGWKIGSNLSQLIEVVWNTILKNIWEPHLNSVRKTAVIDWQCLHWAGEGKLIAWVLRVCQRQHPFYFLKEKKSILQIGLTSYPERLYLRTLKIHKSQKLSTKLFTVCLERIHIIGKITCVTCSSK